MRTGDRTIFSNCAKHFKLWILVRETNAKSLEFVGLPGYVPKPISCKPKTAKLGANAGLVVDPTVLPGAFEPAKLPATVDLWKKFAAHHLGKDGYQVDNGPNSQRRGCLMLNGKYIYGDYDLYDIVIPEQARRNLASVEVLEGERHSRGPRLLEVQRWINNQIGVPMVQHGGEAQYTDHSEQALDVFGPAGEQLKLPNKTAIVSWYNEIFGGRKTIGLQPSIHVGNPNWKPRIVR